MARQFGSNQTRGYRRITSQALNQDSQLVTVDVPRGPHIESLIIRVQGTVTITTGFTAVRAMAPYRFLRRVDWVLNSNVTLDSVSGTQIAQLMVCTRRQLPQVLAPAGFGISAQPIDCSWILDRSLMDMIRPKDSVLKTDVGVSNLQARIQMGNLSDMFTGAGVANYSAGLTLTVAVVDYQEARDQNGNTPAPSFYIKRNGVTQVYGAAANGQQIKINTGNRLRIISLQSNDGATLEPSNGIMSNMRLKRAGDTRVDIDAATLRNAINRPAYGVAAFTGQYVIDLANNGQLGVKYTEFWPIPSSADTYLEVDVVAATSLDIATLEGVDL